MSTTGVKVQEVRGTGEAPDRGSRRVAFSPKAPPDFFPPPWDLGASPHPAGAESLPYPDPSVLSNLRAGAERLRNDKSGTPTAPNSRGVIRGRVDFDREFALSNPRFSLPDRGPQERAGLAEVLSGNTGGGPPRGAGGPVPARPGARLPPGARGSRVFWIWRGFGGRLVREGRNPCGLANTGPKTRINRRGSPQVSQGGGVWLTFFFFRPTVNR